MESEIARICHQCDQKYPKASDLCISCTKRLTSGGAMARICHQCDQKYPKVSEQCINCGQRLSNGGMAATICHECDRGSPLCIKCHGRL